MAGGELEQQVKIRTKDEIGDLGQTFNQMSHQLARSNQLRRQMTADIAHDLRTPLTVIAGYIESMRDGVLSPTKQRLNVIYAEITRLQRLVEDLRMLSRVEAGELALSRQLMPIERYCDRLLPLSSTRLNNTACN
jgi:signal transduction histidine kinase